MAEEECIADVGYFHPRLVARIQICDSAAEEWQFAAKRMAGVTLAALARRGVARLILAGGARECPRFRQVAEASFEGAVEISPLHGSDLLAGLRSMLASWEEPLTVYGVLLEIYGLGVLVTGPSGVGKSELALELLSRGHRLVADDAVELRHAGNSCLIGSSPELLTGFIEARGLGILDAQQLFGPAAVASRARLDLIIDLHERPSPAQTNLAYARLHGMRGAQTLLGQPIPVISLSYRLGHNLAVLAEAGCRDHWLRLGGYHADIRFMKRQQRQIEASRPINPRIQ